MFYHFTNIKGRTLSKHIKRFLLVLLETCGMGRLGTSGALVRLRRAVFLQHGAGQIYLAAESVLFTGINKQCLSRERKLQKVPGSEQTTSPVKLCLFFEGVWKFQVRLMLWLFSSSSECGALKHAFADVEFVELGVRYVTVWIVFVLIVFVFDKVHNVRYRDSKKPVYVINHAGIPCPSEEGSTCLFSLHLQMRCLNSSHTKWRDWVIFGCSATKSCLFCCVAETAVF